MKKKVIIPVIIIAIIVVIGGMVIKSITSSEEPAEVAEGVILASQFVEEVKAGWCLGNTLDSITYTRSHDVIGTETAWGNLVTTKEMIQTVAEAGFDAIRIPVTYYDNCDDDANIDEAWLDRVEEIVNYVLDCDLYCIINVHHDTGTGAWITAEVSEYETSSYRLQRLWEQIAERFKDYDYRLIFEGFNEIIDSNYSWGATNNDNYAAVNDLNQLFVDTVRASGGNNEERILIVNLYAAIPSKQNIKGFVLPTDTVYDRIIVGVHTYSVDEQELDTIFSLLDEYFISEGIAVILGEFGTENAYYDLETRIQYAEEVVLRATALNIPYFWWDNGGTAETAENVTSYTLLNRTNLTWYFPEIVKVLTGTVVE